MATNNRTADVLLRYRVDNSSVNSVRASFDAVQSRIDNLQSDLAGVGTSAQRGVSGLRTQFRTASTDVGRVQGDVESLRAELQRLDDVVVSPEVRVGQSGGGRLETVDRLGTIGSQIAGGFGSGELGNVAGLIGDVAGGIGTLGVVGGAAALAVGAVSLALADLQRISEEAAATAQAQIAGERAAAELAAEGNRAAQEARREEILRLIAFEEAQIAAREARIALNDLNYQNLQNAMATGAIATDFAALARAGQRLSADSDNARESITESQNAIAKLTTEFQGLNVELGVTIKNVVAFADKTTEFIGKIGKEIDKLGASFGSGSIAGTFSAYQDAEAARLAALQTDRAGAYLNSITQTVTAQESLRKAQDAYNETVAASQARIAEINAKLQADLSGAEVERQRDLAEAAADAGEQRVRAEEQKQAEIARIQKRFDRSYANAVAERDALGATRAEQQRDDELEQLDERYKDQLKAVDTGLKAQQKLINDRYSQQVQTVRAGAEAALRLEQQRAQQEINLRQQAVQAATVQLVNALNNETIIRNTFYQQSISQAQSWASLMQLYIAYGLQAPGGVSVVGTSTPYFTGNSTTNPYIGYQGGRAEGGPMYPGGVYKVGERGAEYVTPLYPSMVHPAGSGIGGMTINVVGAQTGTIRAESRAQALAAFDRVLRGMGVA